MFTLKNFTISYNNNDVIDTEEKHTKYRLKPHLIFYIYAFRAETDNKEQHNEG